MTSPRKREIRLKSGPFRVAMSEAKGFLEHSILWENFRGVAWTVCSVNPRRFLPGNRLLQRTDFPPRSGKIDRLYTGSPARFWVGDFSESFVLDSAG